MAAYNLQVDSSADAPNWSTIAAPSAPNTHMLVINTTTKVPSWSLFIPGSSEDQLSIESTTDVMSWV